VWAQPYWAYAQAKGLSPDGAGFRVLRAKVLAVKLHKAVTLQLEGRLEVAITRAALVQFLTSQGTVYSAKDWYALTGKTLEVRGWVTIKKPPKTAPDRGLSYRIGVSSAASVQVLR
jgi:hypothetical protein